jgi:hypothetical protein
VAAVAVAIKVVARAAKPVAVVVVLGTQQALATKA